MVLSGILATVTGTQMPQAEPPADLAAQEEAEALAEKEVEEPEVPAKADEASDESPTKEGEGDAPGTSEVLEA